eukprot:2401322-Prymnesium_polylepis.2
MAEFGCLASMPLRADTPPVSSPPRTLGQHRRWVRQLSLPPPCAPTPGAEQHSAASPSVVAHGSQRAAFTFSQGQCPCSATSHRTGCT